MAKVIIDVEVCKGCGLCVHACPKHILSLSLARLNSRGYQPAEVIDPAACIGCAACARTCPDMAIEIEK